MALLYTNVDKSHDLPYTKELEARCGFDTAGNSVRCVSVDPKRLEPQRIAYLCARGNFVVKEDEFTKAHETGLILSEKPCAVPPENTLEHFVYLAEKILNQHLVAYPDFRTSFSDQQELLSAIDAFTESVVSQDDDVLLTVLATHKELLYPNRRELAFDIDLKHTIRMAIQSKVIALVRESLCELLRE
jgi:hypothetical protein